MTIYFAGSIRGGRDDHALYMKLIEYLQHSGEVLTEHVGDASLTAAGEQALTNAYIYERDSTWLEKADVMVAEVSTPSLGVGYEIGVAVARGIKVLALYREQPGRRLSAMIEGNPKISVAVYRQLEEATASIDNFFKR